MDKKIYVRDIREEEKDVSDYFLVLKKAIYLSKNNTRYMTVLLKDRTGTIEGRIWEKIDEFDEQFKKNDIVYVKSKTKSFEKRLQLNVYEIRRIDEDLSLEEMKAFYRESEKDNMTLRKDFFDLVNEIRTPHLYTLFQTFMERKEDIEKFFLLPASVNVHHVYIGGLLEHSLSLAKAGIHISEMKGANRDLVIAGALLHDIGKIDEIEVKGGFRYSDRGRMLGHITLGVLRLKELIRNVKGFPILLEDILNHIIISHHGIEEWGSPKRPMFIEALIIHYLDNLDAKIEGVREHLSEAMEDERWSTYHKAYESRFLKLSEVDLWK